MRKSFAALLAALALIGCASITRGTDEAVVFDSEPPGAEMRSLIVNICADEGSCQQPDERGVAVSREHKPGPVCVTPCTLPIKRADDLIVTFTKAGYEPKTVKLGRFVAGAGGVAVAGNLIIGGAAGLVTDAVTGAAFDHAPNPLKVALVEIAARGTKR